MPSLKEAALHYAGLGFAVLPLLQKQKTPKGLHGSAEASSDPKQIQRWWTVNPEFNIGIATGSKSKLVVIDVDEDPEKDVHGMQTLRDWEREHGELPDTWIATTGRGGAHYYYKTDQSWHNSAGLLPGIDIRGEGGYVVAPPSVHPNGSVYDWDGFYNPEDQEIAWLSGSALELVEYLRKSKKDKKDDQKYNQTAEIQKGHRQSLLVALIGSLINIGLSEDAIREAVRLENEQKCKPPMSESELEKEVFPAIRRGWEVTEPYTDSVLPVQFTDEDLKKRELPMPVRLGSIWNNLPQPAPELIAGVLRQGHKMIISGPSKAGKSYLLMELAVDIAEGYNWLKSRCKQGKVFYVNMEIDDPSCYRRFQSIYKSMGLTVGNHVDNITIWGLRGHSMPITKLAPKIIEQCRDENYAAIIIDPLYKVIEGDENSNSDIAKMSSGFDMIAQETGASVIYAHHFAKGYAGDRSSLDRGAGAGTFSRDPDAILTITQLDLPDEVNDKHTGWRIEFTLREFGEYGPVDVWWEFPMHKVDHDGILEDANVITSQSEARKKRAKAEQSHRATNIEQAAADCEKADDIGGFTTSAFITEYSKYEDIARSTVEVRLSSAGYIKTVEKAGATGIWHKG